MRFVKYICYWCGYECCEGDMIKTVREKLNNIAKYINRLSCPFCGEKSFHDYR